eukprot:15220599-Ditylum_brightwellii.AAC.1
MGTPYACILNTTKTKILITITGTSIFEYITEGDVSASLKLAIDTYTTDEVVTGLKVLGLPLGSHKYVNSYLTTFAENVENTTKTLLSNLPDTQTSMQIFSNCILQCVLFRLMADIINNATPASAATPFEWHSDLSTTIEKVINLALLTTTEAPAIRYAMKGIPLWYRQVMVDPVIIAVYTDWQTSTLPPFQLYQTLGMAMLEDVPLPKCHCNHDKLRYFTLNYPLRGLQHHLRCVEAKCTTHLLLYKPAEVAHWLTNAMQYMCPTSEYEDTE